MQPTDKLEIKINNTIVVSCQVESSTCQHYIEKIKQILPNPSSRVDINDASIVTLPSSTEMVDMLDEIDNDIKKQHVDITNTKEFDVFPTILKEFITKPVCCIIH